MESAIQLVAGRFSAKTLCLGLIPEYGPGTRIFTESAFYGHAIRFFQIPLYLTFYFGRFRRPPFFSRDCESGFHVSDVII